MSVNFEFLKSSKNSFFVAFGLFLFFVASAAAADAATADAATALTAAAVAAAETALQYLQGAGIRTRDSATADRFTINELHSPPTEY